MAKARANIRGSEVVSVEVGKVWTVVKIKIPTLSVMREGEERKAKRPKAFGMAAKKAWVKRRANMPAPAAAAVGTGN